MTTREPGAQQSTRRVAPQRMGYVAPLATKTVFAIRCYGHTASGLDARLWTQGVFVEDESYWGANYGDLTH